VALAEDQHRVASVMYATRDSHLWVRRQTGLVRLANSEEEPSTWAPLSSSQRFERRVGTVRAASPQPIVSTLVGDFDVASFTNRAPRQPPLPGR
jgi:hypothetical protein